MKLNVCKEITSIDLFDETIAFSTECVSQALLSKVTSKRDFTTVQPNSISKTHIAIRFNLLQFLAIRTFFCTCCVTKMFLHCFKWLFLYFTEFYGHFPCLNWAKIRVTAHLVTQLEFTFQDNQKSSIGITPLLLFPY